MKRNSGQTQSSSESLRIDGIGSILLDSQKSGKRTKRRHQQRPKSASISTFSTRRNESYQKIRKKRPMTAHRKSKKELLNESLTRLYSQRSNLMSNKYSPDEVSRAVRLQRQYQKTLQKRARYINKNRKPKFQSLTKNISCYKVKLRDSKQLLYESPFVSMNVDCFNYRQLQKPPIPWDSRRYNKPKRCEHFATSTQIVTLNTTASYKRIDAMMNNIYRPSVKDFFGANYNAKTGLDPSYIYMKNNKRPIYV